MFKRILSLLLLPFIMLLAACGSSDKAEPKEVILDLRLGTGVGSSFVESDMSASETNLSLGDDTTLSVNIVDLNDDSNLYTDDNRTVIFSSSCESSGLASFSSSTITTSSGLATTTYTASGCSGNDVVTASLSEDSSQSATVTLNTDNYSLSIGTGTGNSFEAEIIEATDSSLDFGDLATLTVNIVDMNNNNDLFTDEEVSVAFSSSCISSGLSSLSESLITTTTGIASTTYTTSGCSSADQVIATVVDTDLTAEIELNTNNNDLQLGSGSSNSFSNGMLTTSAVNLSATGEANISVNIVDANDGNALYTSEVLSVDFSSNCVSAESSIFSATSVSTPNGKASTTYTANSCRGEDIITATLSGTDKTAEVTINVTELELGSISAMEPDHTVLAIQGFSTESLPSTTELRFLVRDKSGNPFAEKEVSFSLFGISGGDEGASVVSLSQETGITDSDGVASVFVNSGYANTTFRVVAKTDVLDEGGVATGQTMQTTSTAISVTTGLPVAHNFGTGVSIFNPRGWHYVSSGDEGVNISATASDLFGGAVVDGNTITFSTYGGRLEESSCVLENGICSVRWQSSEAYRPIATILAYTLGEESFEDANSNGQFDAEEAFTPLAEPLRDDNRNGSYDSGEFFVDSNGNGEWDAAVVDYNETVYRGGTCSDAARELGHCASLAYIYSQPELIMADDEVDGISVFLISGIEPDLIYTRLSSLVAVAIPADGAEYFSVLITDSNGVIPPAGTELSVSCNSTDVAADATQMLSEVPNEFSPFGLITTLNVKAEAVPDDGSVTLTNRSTICFVNVEPEGSVGRGFGFTVNYLVDATEEEEAANPAVE